MRIKKLIKKLEAVEAEYGNLRVGALAEDTQCFVKPRMEVLMTYRRATTDNTYDADFELFIDGVPE